MGFIDAIGGFLERNDTNKIDQHSSPSNSVNPLSGLPMSGSIDIAGNPFGTNNQANRGGMSPLSSFSDPFSSGS